MILKASDLQLECHFYHDQKWYHRIIERLFVENLAIRWHAATMAQIACFRNTSFDCVSFIDENIDYIHYVYFVLLPVYYIPLLYEPYKMAQ